jgi:hypothetical protein
MKKASIPALAVLAVMMLCPGYRVYAQVSQTPPMGFNTYDCLDYSAADSAVKQLADTMASRYFRERAPRNRTRYL